MGRIGRRALAFGRPLPVAPDEILFEIGSITKVFTSVLLARLAIDGLVGLDQPIAELLPPEIGRANPALGRITLVELATHTSGLPRLPPDLDTSRRALVDPYASYGEERLHAGLARLEPGGRGRYRYSNLGAGLLGHLLARRAGASYGEAIADRVLAPLGLRDTFVDVPPAEAARFPDGHSWPRGRPVRGWGFRALAGAGALRSSAGDLLRFLRANLDPPAGNLGDALRLALDVRVHAGPMSLGLGWHLDRGRHWHDGGTGGATSHLALDRDRRDGVVVLANAAPSVIGLLVGRDPVGRIAGAALRDPV